MIRTRTGLSLVLLCVVPALLLGQSIPAVGSAAPEFTLPSQHGDAVSLKDYRGKWVVLYFYPFPGRCPLEVDEFQRDQPEYQKKNAVVFGVSVDSAGSQKNCAKESADFKLLADTGSSVSREYGSLTNLLVTKVESRNTFIIDPAGKVAKVFLHVADPAQQSREVLAALTALQQAK